MKTKLPLKARNNATKYLKRRLTGERVTVVGKKWATLIIKGNPLTSSEEQFLQNYFMSHDSRHHLWQAYGGNAMRSHVIRRGKENLEQATKVSDEIIIEPFEELIGSQIRPTLEDIENEVATIVGSASQLSPAILATLIQNVVNRYSDNLNGTIQSIDFQLVNGAVNSLKQIGRTIQTPLTQQALTDALDDRILPDSTDLFQSIFDRLNSELQKQLVSGQLDPASLAQYLRENGVLTKIDKNGHDWADYYSRFLIASRLEAGKLAGMRLFELETGERIQKMSLSAGDERVRARHIAMEEIGWIFLNEAWPDGYLPSIEPSCRCVTIFQVYEG